MVHIATQPAFCFWQTRRLTPAKDSDAPGTAASDQTHEPDHRPDNLPALQERLEHRNHQTVVAITW
jgi:hypothetical protein